MKKILAMLMLSIFMMGATPFAEASVGQISKAPITANAISIGSIEGEDIKKVKERYAKTKQTVYSLKTKVQACKGLKDTKCIKHRENLRMELKYHVLNNIRLLYNHLAKAEMAFEQRENSEGIVKQIQAYKIELKTFYEQVEKAESKEELVITLKGYRKFLGEMKSTVLGFQHKLRGHMVDEFLTRAKVLESKFGVVIDRFVEEEKPLTAKKLVEEFSSHINSAKANYEKAKSMGESTEESIDLMNKAKEDLNYARALLGKILKALNSNGVSVSDLKSIQPIAIEGAAL